MIPEPKAARTPRFTASTNSCGRVGGATRLWKRLPAALARRSTLSVSTALFSLPASTLW